MSIDQLASNFRRLLMANVKFCLSALTICFFAHSAAASAGYSFIQLEVDDGTYHPGDPVPMTVTVVNHTTDTICNPLIVDVHLTPDGRFRSETDHLLTRLGGPMLAPGETWTFRWVQMMPGHISGTFFIDAEAYTGPGPEQSCGGNLASAFLVETAKITLVPQDHPETELVSVSEGGAAGSGNSETPSLSVDGRWVAFASEATTLMGVQRGEDGEIIVDGDGNPIGVIGNNHSDIFVRDQWTGEMERVTTPVAGSDSNGASFRPRISRDADARWVVFHSKATNLTTDNLTNNTFDVFRHDRLTGTTDLVSRAHNGGQAHTSSEQASVSADGQWVVFESQANNLMPSGEDTNELTDIFLRDMNGGGIRRVNVVDGTLEGQAQGGESRNARISADGRHVVFESRANNLVAGGKSGLWEVYVHDRDVSGSGTFDQLGNVATIRLSVSHDQQGNPVISDGHSTQPDLSADGRFVTFMSEATNLYALPAEGAIVLDGRSADATVRFQENTAGEGTIGFVPDTFATGSIDFTSNPTDGDSVLISDGETLRRFEFDGPSPNGIGSGIRVITGANPTITRNNMIARINEAFFINDEQTIEAVADGDYGILLTNFAYGPPRANQPIDNSNAPTLAVTGMGGAQVTNPNSGDTLEIDTGRTAPVTVQFYEEGEQDPTDQRVVGVKIGRTAKETSSNLFQVFQDLGYREYDLPDFPDFLLPPSLENPEHGDAFILRHGDEEDEDNYQEQTFFFTDSGPQFDPANPAFVRIGATPAITRGNLIRAILANGFTFDALPAIYEATGNEVAFGQSFTDAPATGAVALRILPEDGYTLTISDGLRFQLFRFEDERDQTEEEEDLGIPVPPYEPVGGVMVIYIVPENRAATEQRLLSAIQSSNLNLTVRFGFSAALDRNAILLLNNRVGDLGNNPIVKNPVRTQQEIDDGEEPWALLDGMDGGQNAQPSDGDQITFYPENLLHPEVVFELRNDLDNVTDGAFGVQIGSTGSETEGNFFAALISSGLPWLVAEEPLIDGEPDPTVPNVVLRSFLHTGDGVISFNFDASNPGAFATLDSDPGTVSTPRHGGRIVLNDGVNSPTTFQFTADGSVQEEEFVPVRIGPTAWKTRDNLLTAINDTEHLDVFAVDASDEEHVQIRVVRIEGGPVDDFIATHDTEPFVSIVELNDGQWNPSAGERFEIRDGFSDPVIFEFVADTGGPYQVGQIPLGDPAGEAGGRVETRDNLINAIKDSELRIQAIPAGEDGNPAVRLTHLVAGAVGNFPILIRTEDPYLRENPSFAVRGMSGGGNLGTGVEQVYLVDRDANESGSFDETGEVRIELISKTPLGTAGNHVSLEPTVTDDGRFVAFRSQADDLLPLTVTRSDGEVFKNLPGTTFIDSFSRLTDSTEIIANFTDEDDFSDIYLYDREEGIHKRVDVNRFGESLVGGTIRANFPRSSRSPTMSGDGRFIVFESDDESYNNSDGRLAGDQRIRNGGLAHGRTNRHTIDHNDYRDIFIHDRRFQSDGSPHPTIPGSVTLSEPVGPLTVGAATYLRATVEDLLPDRFISRVEFFADGELVGTATAPAIPNGNEFTTSWTPSLSGSYSLVARATDNRGRTLPLSNLVQVEVFGVNGNPPSSVTITSPAATFNDDGEQENQIVVTNRSTLPLVAQVVAGNSAVNRVEFFLQGLSLGEATRENDSNRWRLDHTFDELPPGSYGLRAIAWDDNGNSVSSQIVSITVTGSDGDAPVVSVEANPDAFYRGQATMLMASASDADGSVVSIEFFANGVSLDTDDDAPFSLAWTTNVAGVYNIVAVATDDEGNTGVGSTTVTVGGADPDPDADFPVVLVRPSDDSLVGRVGQPLFFEATASFANGSIVLVEFIANGEILGEGIRDTDSNRYLLTWVPELEDLGTHSLFVRATNNLGQSKTSETRQVTVQQTVGAAPTVSIISPAEDLEVTNQSTYPLVALASDGDGTIASVEFFLGGASIGFASQENPTSSSWRLNFTFSNISPGEYELVAVARDNNNNPVASQPVGVTVIGFGGTAPTNILLSVNKTDFAFGEIIVMNVSVDDPPGGRIESVEFFANGLPWNDLDNSPNPDTERPFSYSAAVDMVGQWNVYAVATDTWGNTAISEVKSIEVQPTQDAVVTVTYPADGSLYGVGDVIPIRVSTSGGGGFITEVEVFVNGDSLGVTNSRTGRIDWIPESTGAHSVWAVATNKFGQRMQSSAITVNILPLGVVDGNPADPANHWAFVWQSYVDLLHRAPRVVELETYAGRLARGEWTRGQVIAALVKEPEFVNVRWVVAAYLTVLLDPPTPDQLEEGLELLDPEFILPPYFAPFELELVIEEILLSFEFRDKFRQTGDLRPGETGMTMAEDRLLRIVHEGRGTFTKNEERLFLMLEIGRLEYLTLLTESRLQKGENEREVIKTAMVLMLLNRETSRSEVAAIPSTFNGLKGIEAAAEFIVSRDEYRQRFADRFEEGFADPVFGPLFANSLVGDPDPDSGMLVKQSWFGKFNDAHFDYVLGKGWLKHTEHGWVYIANDRGYPNSMWFWDHIQQDWLWTNPSIYRPDSANPEVGRVLFSNKRGKWIHIRAGGTPNLRELKEHNGVWSNTWIEVRPKK